VAYLRKEKETVEIAYSLGEVWTAIPKALAILEWTVEQLDDEAHHIKAKTKGAFMSYGSIISIDAEHVSAKICRVTVAAETPTTTITAIADFGRARERVQLFYGVLAKQLNDGKKA
jgi:hypothetical protein